MPLRFMKKKNYNRKLKTPVLYKQDVRTTWIFINRFKALTNFKHSIKIAQKKDGYDEI